MNERAAELGLEDTSYANPIGLDDPANYSTASDLAGARAAADDASPASGGSWTCRAAAAGDRAAAAGGGQPQPPGRRSIPGSRVSRRDTRASPATCWSAPARAEGGARVISVVLGEPSEAARDADTVALLRWGLGRFHRRARARPGPPAGPSRRRLPRRARRADARTAPPPCLCATDERLRRRVRAPKEVEGPAAGRRAGRVGHGAAWTARPVRRVALVTARDVPGAGTMRVLAFGTGGPLDLARSPRNPGRSRVRRRPATGVRAAGSSNDHHRHPQRRHRQDPGRAELPARPPPPGRRADRHRRRQGRERGPRAAGAGPAGDRHRRGRRPTGTRIVEHLTEEGILNDFVRIREESRTSTAVVDPTSGEQTEINERGPHVSEQELELFVDKLLYLAKGAAVCVFARQPAARRRQRAVRAADRGDAAPRRGHRCSTPRARRCASPRAAARPW